MAAAALLLLLLLLLPPLAALLRRGAGRRGALHLLHPQGALHLSRLARRRGPLLRMRLGGRDVLVLSSAGIIREALVRHCGDWLGRPPSYLGSLVSHGGQDLALGGPCPGWRQQRGAARGALARAGTQLGPLLWLQGQELCEELRSHGGAPLDPFEVFTFHTCSTIARLLFGDLVPPPGELRAFSCCLGELLQVWGRSTVRALDLLPPLRALPNPGLRELLRLVQRRDAFVEAQIRRHQECPSPPSDTVLGVLLGRDPGVQGAPLSPLRLHMALVDLFIGGTETTAAALGWAVAFLLHRPEVTHMSHMSQPCDTCHNHVQAPMHVPGWVTCVPCVPCGHHCPLGLRCHTHITAVSQLCLCPYVVPWFGVSMEGRLRIWGGRVPRGRSGGSGVSDVWWGHLQGRGRGRFGGGVWRFQGRFGGLGRAWGLVGSPRLREGQVWEHFGVTGAGLGGLGVHGGPRSRGRLWRTWSPRDKFERVWGSGGSLCHPIATVCPLGAPSLNTL
ncbi:steroid 21-hydroxylase-like isoform X1 [Manacus candei]|uniref:steroid 21-hydroxylase-like isoform X1 n=1 Tax=Manacus candei TaxID=415023 RepID=UPI002226E92E|nr:steroid 21-hydroxylase-like isoform X1 [Manacus candei]